MLVATVSALMLIATMVKKELQELDEIAVPDLEDRKEAPAPLSTGLLRMRRGGASVDINHIRNFSRTLSNLGRPAVV